MSRAVSWLTRTAYQKAWIVILAVVLILSYGVYALTTVNQELIPDIELPIAVVTVQSPGLQANQVADGAIAPIESATSSLEGLKNTQSTSVAGLGVIVYSFEFGISPDTAKAQLQEALDGVPLGADTQTDILTFDPSTFPVVVFDLQGDLSQSELLRIAQQEVTPALTSLDGVAAVEVVGGAVDEVRITLDRQALTDHGVSYAQVGAALQANNVILPSGQLTNDGATTPIETISLLTSLDTIQAIGVTASDGSTVRLDQLAEVELVPGTPVGYSRTDGQSSVSIQVTKQKDANTVTVANRITDALAELEPTLPEGASISIFENQADYITESITSLIEEGVIGGALAVVVVFLFLRNWRTTIIIALSIPLSLIAAIIVLNQFGYSLNIMTLAGLTIAIGRVIDDSIVVLENVYRHMVEGETPFNAVVNGAREVTIAILGATATTCAVFLPLGFVGGLIGELFLPFALAVTAALVASLLVAITVIPMLTRYTIAGRVKVKEEQRPGDTFLGRIYTPALRWSLANRWKTLIVATVLFIGSMALVPLLPVTFLPASGENTITVQVNAQPGQTAESVLEQAIEVEELIVANFETERYQTVITGVSGDFGAIGAVIEGNSPNSATISVELPSGVDRQDAAGELRELVATDLGAENISVSAADTGFSSNSIQITLAAETPQAQAELPAFTEQVAAAVAGVDEIANVSSNLSAVQPTIEVLVDPALAAEAGLTPAQISDSIAQLSSNRTVTVAEFEDGAHPVRLLVSGVDVSSLEGLSALEIVPGVPLDSVATLSETPKQVSITRINGRPAAMVSADITGDNIGGISAEVQQAVADVDAPADMEVLFGGVTGDIEEGFANMFIAILASIGLVYLIMGLLFRSFVDPFVILFTLPLAAIGAIVALFITGSPLSLSALIGVMMLVGIVVTNAIVMLEFVIMLRKERGYSLHDALVEGAQTRLRPILMTAFAAMLALIPLSLGLTEGLLIAADLGRVVIGGLFTSTLLTLLVIPVVYSLVDGLKVRVAHRRAPKPEAVEAPALRERQPVA